MQIKSKDWLRNAPKIWLLESIYWFTLILKNGVGLDIKNLRKLEWIVGLKSSLTAVQKIPANEAYTYNRKHSLSNATTFLGVEGEVKVRIFYDNKHRR